jgi:preprotein translocase subunit SecD
MKAISISIMIVFLLSCSDQTSEYEYLSFELRLAQSEADSNLQEMQMHNSDLKFYVEDSVFLRNSDIKSTNVIDMTTQPKVFVNLTKEGTDKFAAFTDRYIGRNAAILVGGKLVSAPRINAKIEEGKLIIVGYFTPEEAEEISEGIMTNNK